MTKLAAKELTLEVWTYLAKHIEIETKDKLPRWLYDKIKVLENECPLCETFLVDEPHVSNALRRCTFCPLNTEQTNCYKNDSPFDIWCGPWNKRRRTKAAIEILDIVKAWEV